MMATLAPPSTYDRRRVALTTYFDSTARKAWIDLTSEAKVSGIRATVRAGRERMRATLLDNVQGFMRDDALLAVIFIPTIAFLFAFLAQRWSRNFLAWATAFGGAAMALTGLGRLAPDQLEALLAPDDTASRLVFTVAWLALALLGRTLQVRLLGQGSD